MWLQILAKVPNAILWLLRFPAAGEPHLLRTANEWAGPSVASRVIFTDVAPKQIHIHRGRIADLFLDTPECNAHTTAADILWSGTPILTFPKYSHKMCSRVGASIAYATGHGHEMVVNSEEEYEERAVKFAQGCRWDYVADSALREKLGLAGHPHAMSTPGAGLAQPFHGLSVNGVAGMTTVGQMPPAHVYPSGVQPMAAVPQQSVVHWMGHGPLVDLRRALWENRDQSLLFDTLRWTRNLEKGLCEAWRRWETGQEFDELVEGATSNERRSSLNNHKGSTVAHNGNIIVQHDSDPMTATTSTGLLARASTNGVGKALSSIGAQGSAAAEVLGSGPSGQLSTEVGIKAAASGSASGLTSTHPLSAPTGASNGPLSSSGMTSGHSTPYLGSSYKLSSVKLSSGHSNNVNKPSSNGSEGTFGGYGMPEGQIDPGQQGEPRRSSSIHLHGGAGGSAGGSGATRSKVERLDQQIRRPDVGCIFVCD